MNARMNARMDDAKIISLFFNRNQDAIKETEHKYSRHLQSIAHNILSSQEDTDECVNDTYLAAWNSIPPNKPNSLMAYLSKITRNLALDRLEKQNAKKRTAEMLPLMDEIAEIFPTSEHDSLTDSIALREAINKFLKQLPKEKRILFMRRYFFFDSVEEIAKTEKAGESKIKTALFRIRLELKDHLLAEGITL